MICNFYSDNLEESVYLLEGKENLNDSGKEGGIGLNVIILTESNFRM